MACLHHATTILKPNADDAQNPWTDLGAYSAEAWAALPGGRYLLESRVHTELKQYYHSSLCFVWVEK